MFFFVDLDASDISGIQVVGAVLFFDIVREVILISIKIYRESYWCGP